ALHDACGIQRLDIGVRGVGEGTDAGQVADAEAHGLGRDLADRQPGDGGVQVHAAGHQPVRLRPGQIAAEHVGVHRLLLVIASGQHDELQRRAVGHLVVGLEGAVAVSVDHVGVAELQYIFIAPGGGGDIREVLHSADNAQAKLAAGNGIAAAVAGHIGDFHRSGEAAGRHEPQLADPLAAAGVAVQGLGVRPLGGAAAHVDDTLVGGGQFQQLDAGQTQAAGLGHRRVDGGGGEGDGRVSGRGAVNVGHLAEVHADEDGAGHRTAAGAVSGEGDLGAVVDAAGYVCQLAEGVLAAGGTEVEIYVVAVVVGDAQAAGAAVAAGTVVVVVQAAVSGRIFKGDILQGIAGVALLKEPGDVVGVDLHSAAVIRIIA
ncbi:GDP-mannose-dependent alpha-(1-6)-phosphatidylinositol monomannoside mannosyltransferase, partial [Dysosmobacter welbionis]